MGFHETLSLQQKRLEMLLTCYPANMDNEFGGYKNKGEEVR